MTATSAPPKTLWYKAWIALRFIVFGFGGFWLLMFCWIELFAGPHYSERLLNPFLALILGLISALMTLYGAGEWGRWAYLWVLLSTPLVLSLFMLLPPAYSDWARDKASSIPIVSLPYVVSYLIVKRYYRRRDVKR